MKGRNKRATCYTFKSKLRKIISKKTKDISEGARIPDCITGQISGNGALNGMPSVYKDMDAKNVSLRQTMMRPTVAL